MPDETTIYQHLVSEINKLGFWFWFILFGFFDIIFSIIYRPEYVALGLYFFACGVVGHFITVLLDRISSMTYVKIDKEGKRTIAPPLYYSFITFVVKISVFAGLCFLILKKYPSFI